ncbi:hypothetical protein [Pseudotabrizicola sp. L79]|uniref:hypothetical protein n=1 Tax=Pseudotabrizicola sp. L79 TaxID=3118402 RepID=UPI002F93F016
MTEPRLAEELLTLRRQIARLKAREEMIEARLQSTPALQGALRPGWPIQRLAPGAHKGHTAH